MNQQNTSISNKKGRIMDFVPRTSTPRLRMAQPAQTSQPVKPTKPVKPAKPIEETSEVVTQVEEVDFGIIEDYHQGAEPTPQSDNVAAPDGNKYALGGKSPFLKSVSVEKRPLSGNVPSHAEYHLHKNVYTKKQVAEISNPKSTAVIKPESKKSKAPLILLIFATIIIGAAVGAGAYFFFFQGQ